MGLLKGSKLYKYVFVMIAWSGKESIKTSIAVKLVHILLVHYYILKLYNYNESLIRFSINTESTTVHGLSRF